MTGKINDLLGGSDLILSVTGVVTGTQEIAKFPESLQRDSRYHLDREEERKVLKETTNQNIPLSSPLRKNS